MKTRHRQLLFVVYCLVREREKRREEKKTKFRSSSSPQMWIGGYLKENKHSILKTYCVIDMPQLTVSRSPLSLPAALSEKEVRHSVSLCKLTGPIEADAVSFFAAIRTCVYSNNLIQHPSQHVAAQTTTIHFHHDTP